MRLREYQTRSVNMLYDWFSKNPEGNPVLSLPGGSGKSVIIAEIVRDALHNWPETRVLMLVHSRELISQNADKLRKLWPSAPVGIYSAGLKQKELSEPIIYAGIQSIRNKAEEIGHCDLCIIDEVHAVSHRDEGGYRKFLSALKVINPHMRIIGLSASPFRLGHGFITEGDTAIFKSIIEPVTIEELFYKGYLCKLSSKRTSARLSTEGVHKRGGEFIPSELEKAVNTTKNNIAVVRETIELAKDKKSWIVFCSGVQHAENISALLNANGVVAEVVTGQTATAVRDEKIADFKSGKVRALVGVGIFTTGFDHPPTDCLVFLRPTESPGLYMQMAFRGCRPVYAEGYPLETTEQRVKAIEDSAKPSCLVLDFAGNVELHGPITAVTPPAKKGEAKGEAPVKLCEHCQEIVAISCKVCPACGEAFPPPQAKVLKLHNDDIMGLEGKDMTVTSWQWRKHTSRASGNEMLAVTYYGALSDSPITEYFPVLNPGYAGQKALMQMAGVAGSAGVSPTQMREGLHAVALALNAGIPPTTIEYRRDGKFFRVMKRSWK